MSTIPVQLQNFSLSGAGSSIGDTVLNLKSFKDILGVSLTMASFGTVGYGTIEPGNGTQEEQISFTGITQNTDGSAQLTGIKHVLFKSPFTESSGMTITHPGSVVFIISNTSGYESTLASLTASAQIFTGLSTFTIAPKILANPVATGDAVNKRYVDVTLASGSPNASTVQNGLVQTATQAQIDARTATGSSGAPLVATPNLARSTQLSDYVVDTGTATGYVITPSPAISAYATGQTFSFKAANTNASGAMLNVNGLGNVALKKFGSATLASGDIVSGQMAVVEHDGSNFQVVSPTASTAPVYGATSGTNTYTVATAPFAYTAGNVVIATIGTTSTAASTLNVNGLGAKTIKKLNGSTDITKGDLISGNTYTFIYDGTNFTVEVIQQNSNGTLAVSGNSGANTITTGFKPRIIRINWNYIMVGNAGTGQAMGSSTYINGVYAECFIENSGTSGSAITPVVTVNTSASVHGTVNSNVGSFNGTIGSLTDTGFTLTLSQSPGDSSVSLTWEALS